MRPASRDLPDTLEIEVPVLVDPGPFPARTDLSYLAWFEIGYQRRLAAENDTLQFASPDSTSPGRVQYALTAIRDSATAWLLDRTDPETPVRLVGGAWSGAAPAFALTVEDSVGGETSAGTRWSRPARAASRVDRPLCAGIEPAHGERSPGNREWRRLRDRGRPMFLAQAETLAVYRSAFLSGVPRRASDRDHGPRLRPVRIGPPEPGRDPELGPVRVPILGRPAAYVCLLGDASYDPKNHSDSTCRISCRPIPTNYDPTLRPSTFRTTFFGFLDGPGDLLLDLVLGRLPAGNAAQAATLVSGKSGPSRRPASSTSGARARSCARTMPSAKPPGRARKPARGPDGAKGPDRLPKPVERQKIYLNDYAFADTTRQSKPAAREEFIAQVNRGDWLTDYVGHGSEDVLADEQLFRSLDAAGS